MAEQQQQGQHCGSYLIISGISKANNVEALCFAAASHRLLPVIVGLPAMPDSHLTALEPPFAFLRFGTLGEVVEFLSQRGVPLVGIEIIDKVSVPFLDWKLPADGRGVALMPGNEGTGLSKQQKEACESFVYIPQLGAGTASLNVHVATSLILHRHFGSSQTGPRGREAEGCVSKTA